MNRGPSLTDFRQYSFSVLFLSPDSDEHFLALYLRDFKAKSFEESTFYYNPLRIITRRKEVKPFKKIDLTSSPGKKEVIIYVGIKDI